ncbi:MAG: carboxypeptidase-like regulatory domain-containing protein [Candidatus Acidiferrales bacterium]
MPARFARFWVPFLLLTGALASQEAPSQKSEKGLSKDSCSIAGQVVKSGTKEPLKKAHVYLQKEDDQNSGYSAITDAAGHFVIQKIESGRYELRVERTGYVLESNGQHSPNSQAAILALDPGRKIQDLLFRMAPWAIISGRVTDEDGEPVPNVEVQAMRTSVRQGKRTLASAGGVNTNDLGEFRIYGLAKGHYFIRAQIGGRWKASLSYSNSGDTGSGPETGYAPIFYPGTPDEARAAAIDVMPGQEVPSVDLTLIPIRTFRIRGHVLDAVLGQPAKDCGVALMRHDPNPFGYSFGAQKETSCTKGAFELSDVVPGSYYLIAMSMSAKKTYTARVAVEVVNTNVDDLTLTFVPGIDLTGRILVEGHEPMDVSELQVVLYDPEQYFSGAGSEDVKADGTFIAQNVAEGNYQVHVAGERGDFPPDFYFKSARANGEEVLEKGLTIGQGGSRGPLVIVLSSAGARVEGSVTDENDSLSVGAVVALVPEGERRKQFRFYKDTTTDQYGKFILRGIAPGEYKLFSWKGVEDNAWEDPDFLKPFESKGVVVTAGENGHIAIQLRLIPTAKQSP